MGVKCRRFHKTPTTSSRSPGKRDGKPCISCGRRRTAWAARAVAGLRTDTARHLAFNAPETYVLLPHRLYICFSLHVFLYTNICIYLCTHMVVLMSFYPWSLYIPTFLRMSYGRYTRILLTPSKQAKLDEDKTAAHQ